MSLTQKWSLKGGTPKHKDMSRNQASGLHFKRHKFLPLKHFHENEQEKLKKSKNSKNDRKR